MTRLLITLFGLLTFYILVRILTPQNFGIWTIFLSVITVSESVRNAFIYNPLIRYLNSSDKEDYSSIVSSSFALNLLSSLVIIILMIILSTTIEYFWDAPALSSMFLVYIFGALAFTWFSHNNFLQQANLQFKGTFIAWTVQKGAFFGYILYIYVYEISVPLIQLVIVYVITYWLSTFIAIAYGRIYHGFKFNNVRKAWSVKLFHYGKFTLGTNISSMVDKSVSDWLLGSLLSPRAVAIYNPAIRVSSLFEIPLSAVTQVFYPKMVSRAEKEGEQIAKYMYEKSIALILMMIIPYVVVVFIFAEPIILFIAGEQYLESVELIKVAIFYGMFFPFHRQFGVTLNAIGKASINFHFVFISSLVGIAVKYFAIQYFGIIGAVYGTLFMLILGIIVIQIILYRHLKVNMLNIFIYLVQGVRDIVTKGPASLIK